MMQIQLYKKNEHILSRFLNYWKKLFYIVSSFFIHNEKNITLESGNTNDEFYANLKDHFVQIVIQSDPREAIHVLEEESAKDEKTMAYCHDILHVIGHTAFDKYGNFTEAVQYQSEFCNSGYIHGLFESYFKSEENPRIGLSEQCDGIGIGKRQYDIWQCNHGIGHGFMYLTGGDLDKSLSFCEAGLQKPDAVSSCQNGVYMEVFNSEILSKEKDFVGAEDPFLTCKSRKIAKADCYFYLPTYLSQTLNKDFRDILKECNKTEIGYRDACISGVGGESIKRNMNSPENVFSLCQQAGSYVNQVACVSGVVSTYLNQMGTIEVGEKLCETAPEFLQEICSKKVESEKLFFK